MIDFTNFLTRLTTWLYNKKYISKKTHDRFMIEIASYRHERKRKKHP